MNLSIAPCEFYSDVSVAGDSTILRILNNFSTFGQQERRVSLSPQCNIPNREKYVTFSARWELLNTPLEMGA